MEGSWRAVQLSPMWLTCWLECSSVYPLVPCWLECSLCILRYAPGGTPGKQVGTPGGSAAWVLGELKSRVVSCISALRRKPGVGRATDKHAVLGLFLLC